jgi:DNA-binding transcriptional regulator YdaS (Cro superfamily)
MAETSTDYATFAAIVGVHCVTVYRWVSGAARPSYRMMVQIEEATGGRVTARSLTHAQKAA